MGIPCFPSKVLSITTTNRGGGRRNYASFCRDPARKSFSKEDPANSLICEQYAVIWLEMRSDSMRLGTSTCIR